MAILEARAAQLAAEGRRTWEPSPDAPALVIIIDEYAELADDAAEAMSDADSIARLGRAVAVTLIAATQRPTQKAMGQGAVRSQMDLRIAFRVRERKDVDLILGQGMLTAGWHAHTLNAPGKFLISAPEHTTPRRARAYLLTDQAVADTAARYAGQRPELDETSQRAISAAAAADAVADLAGRRLPARRQPARAGPRGRGTDGRGHAVARAVPGSRRGHRRRRADPGDRNEPPHAVPAAGRARQGGPRDPGQPRTLARPDDPGAAP